MKWLNYEVGIVRSSRRKTLQIIVERDGSLSVQCPNELTESEISEILNQKQYSIIKMLSKWQLVHENDIHRAFVEGQTFPYLGQNYSLKLVEPSCINKSGEVELKDNFFILDKTETQPALSFKKFYKAKCKKLLKERYSFYSEKIEKKPATVSVREMNMRWGSCTPEGKVFISWQNVMAPLYVFDYLLVHELIHLKYPNHSRDFWNAVSFILPNYEEAKNWLIHNGVTLQL